MDYKKGMTVKDLKDLIKDWPEENHIGEPTEVWILFDHHRSAPCVSVERLNHRVDHRGSESADILFEPNI